MKTPKHAALVFALASQIGVFEQAPSNVRVDSGESLLLAQQLEHVRAETYKIEYPELMARQLFPVDNSVPSGAETHAFYVFDYVGRSSIIANYADDLPLVNLKAEKKTAPLKGIGNSYSYSIQDLRAAAFAGVPLDSALAAASREAHETTVDFVAAFGEGVLPGALNNSAIPEYSPINGAWISGPATPTEILADMDNLPYQVVKANKFTAIPNVMLLPTNLYHYVASTRVSDLSETTILQSFLKTNPYIKEVRQWHYLDAAGTPSGSRIMVFKRDKNVIAIIESQPYEQLPPQAEGLMFVIYTHGRIGGVEVKKPKACGYMDGCD